MQTPAAANNPAAIESINAYGNNLKPARPSGSIAEKHWHRPKNWSVMFT